MLSLTDMALHKTFASAWTILPVTLAMELLTYAGGPIS